MKLFFRATMLCALVASSLVAQADEAPVLAPASGTIVQAPGVSVVADPAGVIVEAPGVSVVTAPGSVDVVAPTTGVHVQSQTVLHPAPQVVVPAPQPVIVAPAPTLPAMIGTRCVTYHDHKRLLAFCRVKACGSRIDVVTIQDPRCGDCIDLPICVPGLCPEEPVVSARKRLLLGGSVAVIRYSNGFVVKVVIDRAGNLAVHSFS